MTSQEPLGEWSRLVSAPTLVGALTGHVTDLGPAVGEKLPAWLRQLHLPSGWLPARFGSSPSQPTRMAVCGPRPDGSWDASETISVCQFTGTPPAGLAGDASDRMLRDLGVEAVITYPLNIPPAGHVSAVRSSGYFSAAGQRIWLQYSTYLIGSESPGAGLLVEHGIFVDPDRQAGLGDDITELSNTVHDKVVCSIENMVPTPQQNVLLADGADTGDLPPKEASLVTFRIEPFEDMGDPAILVNADRDGMRMFQAAVRSAHETGAATFEFEEIKHYVVRQDDAADVDLRPQTVVWRFDDAKLVEMLNLIEPLVTIEKPAHNYFDNLHSPVETIVLSVDEYTGRVVHYEFSQLLSTPPPVEPQQPAFVRVEATRGRAAPEPEPSRPSRSEAFPEPSPADVVDPGTPGR